MDPKAASIEVSYAQSHAAISLAGMSLIQSGTLYSV